MARMRMKIGKDFHPRLPAFRPQAIKGVRVEHTDASGIRFPVKVIIENPSGNDAPTLFALTQQKGAGLMMLCTTATKLIHTF
jgi:hypothetical protein